jgi:uncharacterized membrane protein
MTMDTRFAISIAIMAAVAFACRAIGLIVGTHLGDSPKLRRFLDILPACAMGAVLGPSLAAMTTVQALAVVVSAATYLASARFLPALALGTAVLLCAGWMPAAAS